MKKITTPINDSDGTGGFTITSKWNFLEDDFRFIFGLRGLPLYDCLIVAINNNDGKFSDDMVKRMDRVLVGRTFNVLDRLHTKKVHCKEVINLISSIHGLGDRGGEFLQKHLVRWAVLSDLLEVKVKTINDFKENNLGKELRILPPAWGLVLDLLTEGSNNDLTEKVVEEHIKKHNEKVSSRIITSIITEMFQAKYIEVLEECPESSHWDKSIWRVYLGREAVINGFTTKPTFK